LSKIGCLIFGLCKYKSLILISAHFFYKNSLVLTPMPTAILEISTLPSRLLINITSAFNQPGALTGALLPALERAIKSANQ
jgi:hypothetical protein